ncbi:MAG: TRAP transporter substrate-binding protein DctP [Cyanobacteria bacterium J06639_16]
MKRRALLGCAATGSMATGLSSIHLPRAMAQNDAVDLPNVEWRMATSWPPALDTLYGTAEEISDRVKILTAGRFTIEVAAAGEIVPGLQVLDAVQAGTVQCGHSAAYYYIGKNQALAFGTAMPFGLTARQQNAWFYEGGGIDVMNQVYADFNALAFPAGNTGVQMGGWFKQEVPTLDALKGSKMRTAGLAGEVFSRLGVNVQALPAGEILIALELGTIDAAEWVGPYDDEKLGLHETAPYYYGPSWWEPGPSLDLMINREAWDALPQLYRDALKTAAAEANASCLAKYDARNPAALTRLIEGGTQLRTFSEEILVACARESAALLEEYAADDAMFRAVYEAWKPFRDREYEWHRLSELSFSAFVAQ